MEGRYRKTMEKKTEEIELLITVLYDLRNRVEPVNVPHVLKDRNNNVLKN
jgi:hypothetical protein